MAARSRRATRSLPLATRDAKRARQETVHAAAQRHAPSELRPRELDTLIHERLRLGIVSALAVNESLSFNELKHLLETTDGNLSVHARKLEEAGYVASDKSFEGRVPRTTFRLTAAGRRALEKYLAHMEAIISALKS
jgi:DNA-binding MarR family transcriptional regulator